MGFIAPSRVRIPPSPLAARCLSGPADQAARSPARQSAVDEGELAGGVLMVGGLGAVVGADGGLRGDPVRTLDALEQGCRELEAEGLALAGLELEVREHERYRVAPGGGQPYGSHTRSGGDRWADDL